MIALDSHRQTPAHRVTARVGAAVVLAAALLAGTASGSSASPRAQGDERVTIREVDTSAFPQVEVEVQIAGQNPGRNAFALREDGNLVPIERVVTAGEQDTPVSVILALDISGSMANSGALEQAKKAAVAYIRAANDHDRLGLVVFDEAARVVAPLGTDHDELVLAAEAVEPGMFTALWDALVLSATELAAEPSDERYVLVVSDIDAGSYDNASQSSAGDAIAAAAASGTSVLAVGIPVGDVDDRELRDVTDQTDGLLLYAEDLDRLGLLFGEIQESLRTRYRIVYQSRATGPQAELLLTMEASRTSATFEVPSSDGEPEPAVVQDELARWPLLLLAVAVAGLIVLILRMRSDED